MTTLKLYGFTDQERELLQRKIPSDRWTVGQREELDIQRPEEEVWVVARQAVETFRDAPFTPSHVLLWVPEEQGPLPFEEWVDCFEAQLQEERKEDLRFLRKVSRCPKVLEWAERVEDIEVDWFDRLTESPWQGGMEQLPFTEPGKLHIQKCDACREEAYEQLQWRASMRWMLCPSVEKLGAWLKVEGVGEDLIQHLTSCGLCQETVKRLTWLYEGAGLLAQDRVDAKFAAIPNFVNFVRAVPPMTAPEQVDVESLREPQPWLTATWQRVSNQVQSLAEVGADMVKWALSGGLQLATGTVASRTIGGLAGQRTDFSMERLKKAIDSGNPVQLTSESSDRWLSLMATEDVMELRVGHQPSDRFERFRLEFRKDAKLVLSVEAKNGVARLTMEDFSRAQQADQFVIIEEKGKDAEEADSLPSEAWRVLSKDDRSAYRKMIHNWLTNPDRTTTRQIITSLLQLAADDLVNDAYQRAYSLSGKDAEKQITSFAKVLRNEVAMLVREDQDRLCTVVTTTLEWWQNRRKKGNSRGSD